MTATPPAATELSLHQATDGISSLRFTQHGSLLVTSWDGGITLYSTASGAQQARVEASYAVLCSAVDSHSSVVYSGGLDRVVNSWNIESGKSLEAVGTHENAVRCIEYNSAHRALVSGGWDCAVRVWDVRTPPQLAPVTLRMPNRIFAMDVYDTHVAVGLQDGSIRIYDWKKSETPLVDRPSSLGHQIRCLRFVDSGAGLVSGSIEGRVAVENTQASLPAKRYTFKCHRANDKIFPVNALCVHPVAPELFCTGGADGSVAVWHQVEKRQMYSIEDLGTSVSACEFSPDGQLLAAAASYTFEAGDIDHPPDQVFLYSHSDKCAVEELA